jgi:hypothetical protein
MSTPQIISAAMLFVAILVASVSVWQKDENWVVTGLLMAGILAVYAIALGVLG